MKTALSLLFALLLGPMAQGQTAPLKAPADVVALLNGSANAYAKLQGLSMHFSVHDDNSGTISNSSGTIAFSRPGKARVEGNTGKSSFTIVSDGVKVYTQLQPVEYRVAVAPNDPIGNVLGRIPSALSVVLPTLAAGRSPLEIEGVTWSASGLLPGNGVKLVTRFGSDGPPITFSFYFDPADKLLRRVEAAIVFKGKKSINLTTLTQVKVDPQFAPDAFNFKPDTGAKEVVEGVPYNSDLKVGLAPLALQGHDLDLRTHPWSQYRDKVVLLEFWSELSDPFLEQLPSILANYQKYHAQGFEILGVALDPDQEKVQAFIKAHKMEFPNLYDPKGFRGSDFNTYDLRKVPFGVLVGKDGKVAAIDPVGAELQVEIEKALKG